MKQVLFTIKRNECGFWDFVTTDSVYNSENKFDVPFALIPGTMNSITHWCQNIEGIEPKQAVFIIE